MFNLSTDHMEYTEKIMFLSRMNFDYLNINAIFSDETTNFRKPEEPKLNDKVSIKIRTGKDNVDKVFLCICENEKIEMEKIDTDNYFDYYITNYKCVSQKTNYYFNIIKSGRNYFYNKQGLTKSVDQNFNFVILTDFSIPKWAKGTVMYQIYVDRFYNGDKKNDVANNEYAYMGRAAKRIERWDTPVAKDDICNFYGGDLKGVIDKMDYLKHLGIDVIYFNPIFVSPSNHKYDVQDYDYVDPHIGVIVKDGGDPLYFEKFHNRFATMYMQRTTNKENLEASNELMVRLIEIAHKNNIKVILDGVFNHCGAFNKWMDKESFYLSQGYPVGAYREKNSIYHDYFKWYDDNWPNNDCYDSWWGHDNHPKLNYEGSKQLYDYILKVGQKWVSPPYNADGWRLDVAADLGFSKEFNHKFWHDFRKAVKEANPNAIILAEHYGDANDWLNGDQWDSIMNYDAFMEPITWFLTGMEKHSEAYNEGMYCNARDFENTMRYYNSRFSIQSIQIAMNELSNHDHSRFLTRTNKKVGRLHTMGREAADTDINKGIMREAVTFQMTWIGAPTIYYGDEAGVTGWTDPDNRRTYPWGKEDKDLIEYHRHLIKIRKKNKSLKIGSTEYLTMDYGIISYARWYKNKKHIIILNNNNVSKEIAVPVWRVNILNDNKIKSIISSDQNGFSLDENYYDIKDGYIKVNMPAFSSIILQCSI